ncbi:histidine kinase, partial [Streptomyces sp. NPDC059814]
RGGGLWRARGRAPAPPPHHPPPRARGGGRAGPPGPRGGSYGAGSGTDGRGGSHGTGSGTDARERATAPAPHPVHDEPVSRIAGVSSSGLPLRQRNTPQQWPTLGKRGGTDQRSGAAAPRPSPRRRDSRQVSDVLAAYAQGINRSSNPRGRSATDDDTERTKK